VVEIITPGTNGKVISVRSDTGVGYTCNEREFYESFQTAIKTAISKGSR
jgi:hypothetical protein